MNMNSLLKPFGASVSPFNLLSKGDSMKWLTVCLLVGMLTGCASASGEPEHKKVSAMVGIVNHTDRYIYSASVAGAGGDGMPAYGAGGASICCAAIPAGWYPGMKVEVRWNMPIGELDVVKMKEVEVEKYDEPGDIYLHFFPEDRVRVIVTRYGGASTKHPIPAPVAPAGWKKN
jgi:hypothetical protein